jgi:hypothetical protein
LAQDEKRGGSIVRDPAREWVEDIVVAWDLLDIKPTKGRYTWTNKRIGPGHIAARLDRFLVQSSFLVLGLKTNSEILPHSASDHKPIRLEIKKDQVKGPIPFRFSPNWINDKGFADIVTKVWATTVQGSASYVWEEKIKRLKYALKSWAKTQPSPAEVRLTAQGLLEAHQLIMERKEITPEILKKRGHPSKGMAPCLQIGGELLETEIKKFMAERRRPKYSLLPQTIRGKETLQCCYGSADPRHNNNRPGRN